MENNTDKYDGGDVTFNNFNSSYMRGVEGENEFTNLINNKRVEIKYEQHQCIMTGNIFIEFEQKTRKTKRWVWSGIMKDFDTLAYGIYNPIIKAPIFIILDKESILELLRWGKKHLNLQIKEKSSEDGTNITRGVLFPLNQLLWNEKLSEQYKSQIEEDNKKRLKNIYKDIKNKK